MAWPDSMRSPDGHPGERGTRLHRQWLARIVTERRPARPGGLPGRGTGGRRFPGGRCCPATRHTGWADEAVNAGGSAGHPQPPDPDHPGLCWRRSASPPRKAAGHEARRRDRHTDRPANEPTRSRAITGDPRPVPGGPRPADPRPGDLSGPKADGPACGGVSDRSNWAAQSMTCPVVREPDRHTRTWHYCAGDPSDGLPGRWPANRPKKTAAKLLTEFGSLTGTPGSHGRRGSPGTTTYRGPSWAESADYLTRRNPGSCGWSRDAPIRLPSGPGPGPR